MLERIGLASALLNDPGFLILDEPTTGLDPIGSRDMRNLFLRLRDEGKTILLSSHYLSEVERISDRVGILHQGKLMDIGNIRELMVKWQTDDIEDLFIKVIEWSNPL
jgi:ABC-2 type transport system ATP-binding protein